MTQKWLGGAVGFPEKSADIRMAQYESGTRTPKENLVDHLAGIFNVDPRALTVPDIDNYIGLIHTLFAIEDVYGLTISTAEGKPCLVLNKERKTDMSLLNMISEWKEEAVKLSNGEITKDEYDNWRYTYPKVDIERTRLAIDDARKKGDNKL